MTTASAERRTIEVVLDESMRQNPRLTLAGAAVFESMQRGVDTEITELYHDISGSFYLDDARSFEKFRKSGFHATDDTPDISSQFVRLVARMAGTKLFIEFSDHSSRPDLSAEQTIALLEVRLVETILRKFTWADHVRFTFEQHPDLSRHYSQIVQVGKRRARFRGDVSVRSAPKMDPPSLAVVDYALFYFARARDPEAKQWEVQYWRAFRPLVSSIRLLDEGGIRTRRGLATDA